MGMRPTLRGWIHCGPIAAAIGILGAAGVALAEDACRVAKLTVSDGGTPFESFGQAVAVSGETALVGAFWDDNTFGAAYVYRFDGQAWTEQQRLVAWDGEFGDEFGRAVAIDGNTAMIGALQHLHAGANAGVYVFGFNGTSWVPMQELLNGEAIINGFGYSVSISGELAVIGAAADDDNGVNSGAAYILRFDPEASQWVQEQKLLASVGAGGAFFGLSVAICGDLAVVGAYQDTAECSGQPTFGAGAAYVFRFDRQSSQWLEEQRLVAPDCASSDNFGSSVSVRGATVLVGARGADFMGAVYVFQLSPRGSRWIQTQKLVASDAQGDDQFGISVSMDGETALIGARFDDDAGPSHGSAYIFRRQGGSWVEHEKLLPDPGPWTAFFGNSVALSGDTAVIGAHGEDMQRGAAYTFAGLSDVDCNGNGVSDACEILDGQSEDVNGNQIPDECECLPDLDGDGSVATSDLLDLLGAWGPNPGHPADLDGDGNVATSDLLMLLGAWGPCPK